jgi:L-arabinose isomerase
MIDKHLILIKFLNVCPRLTKARPTLVLPVSDWQKASPARHCVFFHQFAEQKKETDI